MIQCRCHDLPESIETLERHLLDIRRIQSHLAKLFRELYPPSRTLRISKIRWTKTLKDLAYWLTIKRSFLSLPIARLTHNKIICQISIIVYNLNACKIINNLHHNCTVLRCRNGRWRNLQYRQCAISGNRTFIFIKGNYAGLCAVVYV